MDREAIPPDVLRNCTIYTLDSYNDKGEAHKNGTSKMAMFFLASWLNEYAKVTKFPIYAEAVSGSGVRITDDSPIADALRRGGAVVTRVFLGCAHYVTLTGLSENSVSLFDPYYIEEPFDGKEITLVTDCPFSENRRVSAVQLNREGDLPYALGAAEAREAVILYNTATRKTPEDTIEYFL